VIRGEDNRLRGTLTVRCLAEGGDPKTGPAGQYAEGKPVTIGAYHSIEEALRTMTEHRVRCLPVVDGHDLVRMISRVDIGRKRADMKPHILRGRRPGSRSRRCIPRLGS
jgi:CBS domain-containing protein